MNPPNSPLTGGPNEMPGSPPGYLGDSGIRVVEDLNVKYVEVRLIDGDSIIGMQEDIDSFGLYIHEGDLGDGRSEFDWTRMAPWGQIKSVDRITLENWQEWIAHEKKAVAEREKAFREMLERDADV